MTRLPKRREQIVQAHARLIVGVVRAVQNRDLLPELEQALRITVQNGWTELVAAIRRILDGERDPALMRALDEEDGTIVEAILQGLQDPATLPDPDRQADPALAAPGLATMINAAGRGNMEALQLLASMAEQMAAAGGDMARIGGLMKRLVDGERDADRLCEGLPPQAASLLVSILEELGRLETH